MWRRCWAPSIVLVLNVVLLLQTFGVPIPGLPDAG